MAEWAAKRFWTEVTVVKDGPGHGIRLDGRAVRTPGKSALILPTRALADLVAAEWAAQEGVIDPTAMPATRMANSAVEKVAPQMEAVVDYLLEYGGTDLLCYRAEGPAELVADQARAWDPWLAWAKETFGAELRVTVGVLPVPQPDAALARLRAPMAAFSPFQLAAFHDLVTLPGSLVLGLAAAGQAALPETLWQVSRVDELWQIAQWGADEEAEEAARRKAEAFAEAARFFHLAAD